MILRGIEDLHPMAQKVKILINSDSSLKELHHEIKDLTYLIIYQPNSNRNIKLINVSSESNHKYRLPNKIEISVPENVKVKQVILNFGN